MRKNKRPKSKIWEEVQAGKAQPDAWAVLVPLSQQWMTPELIAETQRVWGPYYDQPMTVADAVEILGNVKAYAEVMLRIEAEYDAEKQRTATAKP